MKVYHRNWLKAHENRTEEWLMQRLADGFAIHHLDGNHDNNSSDNLVLIEGSDHLMLHSGKRPSQRELIENVKARNEKLKTYTIGKNLYAHCVSGLSLIDAAELEGCSIQTARKWLTKYCDREGLAIAKPTKVNPVEPRKPSIKLAPNMRILSNGMRVRVI